MKKEKRRYFLAITVIITLIVAFFTSIILIALGISTMYQAKIYGEVKQRPIYIAKETNAD